jgi:hypothetical protein
MCTARAFCSFSRVKAGSRDPPATSIDAGDGARHQRKTGKHHETEKQANSTRQVGRRVGFQKKSRRVAVSALFTNGSVTRPSCFLADQISRPAIGIAAAKLFQEARPFLYEDGNTK